MMLHKHTRSSITADVGASGNVFFKKEKPSIWVIVYAMWSAAPRRLLNVTGEKQWRESE